MTTLSIPTSAGNISVLDTGGPGPVAFMIHGNSACKEIFQKQYGSPLNGKFRFIAIDLPGHGKSGKAANPHDTYTIPGYADVAIEVLKKMNIQKASIIGWSLGGHIAIDMMKKWPGIQGVFLTGTPPIPISGEGFEQGFRPFPSLHRLMTKEELTPEEAQEFVGPSGISTEEAPFFLKAALNTHGVARSRLMASLQEGWGGNQKETVETSDTPVAVVCGQDDKGINNEYIFNEVAFKNLWDRQIHVIDGGHGVFWQNPDRFNSILGRFLTDMNRPKKTFFKAACAVAIAVLGFALHRFLPRA
ncbi:MAG: alpha/beta hydrolase [Parachlamydiales bacterium]|nr:alpha/beta hydrolase [Parachlamydiales bacterium]